MKLYEIVEEYRKLQDAINDGLIPDEAVDDMLEAVQVPFEEKVDSMATWIKELDSEMKALDNEMKNLAERKKSKGALVTRLKNSIMKAMDETGHTKVETPRNKVSTRISERVEVYDMNALLALPNAEEFVRYAEPAPNKTAISKAIKDGQNVDGCAIVNSLSVQIK